MHVLETPRFTVVEGERNRIGSPGLGNPVGSTGTGIGMEKSEVLADALVANRRALGEEIPTYLRQALEVAVSGLEMCERERLARVGQGLSAVRGLPSRSDRAERRARVGRS